MKKIYLKDKFYQNQGTGTFKSGVAASKYTYISYIKTTGTQYIDTGIIPNQDTGFDISFLTKNDIKVNVTDYISSDVAKQNKAIPFDIIGNKIKVCFADTLDRKSVDTVRLILLNKGLIMEKYILKGKLLMP